MQIFATFEFTSFLEIAISELKSKGITDIYAVPLDARKERAKIMDSMHRADGVSMVDKGFILAFLLATIGASKGFAWEWGPVIWGLIGAGTGFGLGLLISWFQYVLGRRKSKRRTAKGGRINVILIVTCSGDQVDAVKDVLWDHFATGMAVTK